jgi:hypothetical protein
MGESKILSPTLSRSAEPLVVLQASCLLAFVAVPLAVLPIMFYILGPKIRARSPFAGQVAKMEAAAKEEKQKQLQARQEA